MPKISRSTIARYLVLFCQRLDLISDLYSRGGSRCKCLGGARPRCLGGLGPVADLGIEFRGGEFPFRP